MILKIHVREFAIVFNIPLLCNTLKSIDRLHKVILADTSQHFISFKLLNAPQMEHFLVKKHIGISVLQY